MFVLPKRSVTFYNSRIALAANGAVEYFGYRTFQSWLTPKLMLGSKISGWHNFSKTGARSGYYLDYFKINLV